ncbi:MAG TPA: hypothetical protein VMZ66_10265, partial [Aeromicrobium sp.]|nr:hypothetical protein [Aeromicrobium sp.]
DFTFSSSEPIGGTFECELTGPGQSGGFTACNLTKTYTGLADGEYTFSVRAIDTVGNTDATPATSTFTLVFVNEIFTDWTTVSAGGSHTCGVRSTGALYCWGDDANGQAGNGAITGNVTVPKQITSVTDWKTVSAGGTHTCAIRSNGSLYCWGNDSDGQVGNGASFGSTTNPVQITSATDWKTVSAKGNDTCAIRSTGKLYCWGDDGVGQVGNGSITGDVTSPAQITSATDWKAVAVGGNHTCAVRGKLYCWGNDGFGQVGNGSITGNVTSPAQITSATDWTAVAARGNHTCAVRGKLYCWGDDGFGQVGNGATTGNVTSPTQITTATTWTAATAGGSHTCAVRGALYCWGDDGVGQLGNGATTGNVTSPAQITAATDWKSVSAGGHTCAIRSIGKLYCWGSDSAGQVGNGATTGNVTSPRQV